MWFKHVWPSPTKLHTNKSMLIHTSLFMSVITTMWQTLTLNHNHSNHFCHSLSFLFPFHAVSFIYLIKSLSPTENLVRRREVKYSISFVRAAKNWNLTARDYASLVKWLDLESFGADSTFKGDEWIFYDLLLTVNCSTWHCVLLSFRLFCWSWSLSESGYLGGGGRSPTIQPEGQGRTYLCTCQTVMCHGDVDIFAPTLTFYICGLSCFLSDTKCNKFLYLCRSSSSL